uniref:Uncharacterized protein n=1 Tax=Tanacetum cinerariifolium TaxID=118510 RepID=A0A699GM23_TANCI|nr:hypothetical protein [Tanacetum cinerariifolium]
MEFVKKSIDKRALHKRYYDRWVNERQMQTTEEKVDTSKALDAILVDTERSRTKSKEHDASSRSGNDAHDDDADIRPIYDEEQITEREPNFNSYASNRGSGRCSRGGRGQASGGLGDASGGRGHASGGLGEANGSLGESNAARFQANTARGESSGGGGRSTGRGGKSVGLEGEVVEVKAEVVGVEGEEMNEEEIKKNMEHEYIEQILIEEEEKRIVAEKAIQE